MNHEENKAIAKESLPMNKTPNPTAPNDAPTTETATHPKPRLRNFSDLCSMHCNNAKIINTVTAL